MTKITAYCIQTWDQKKDIDLLEGCKGELQA